MRMKSGTRFFTIFAFFAKFGFVTPSITTTPIVYLPPEEYDEACWMQYGGVNFFAWVVRISVVDWFETHRPEVVLPPHVIATGNIITENYILTACTPFAVVIYEERWDLVRVLPAVTEYSTILPIPENGTFPWAVQKGCIVGHYFVHQEVAVTDRPCDANSDDYPAVMSKNMMLLQLASKITVGDYKLFPRMPFNYNIEPLVQKIDWFNTYRKARCVIGRVTDATTTEDGVTTYYNYFEMEGFHYATLPYRGNCAPAICEKNCSEIAATRDCQEKKNSGEECEQLNKCMASCLAVMEPYLGTLMCLIRMHEHERGGTQPYSITYDIDNMQTPFTEENACVPAHNHPASKAPLFMGAPVVCEGEVIAIVTKCDKNFIMATSIVSIRHRLLKLFDTSYEKDLIYLTDI